MLLTRTLTLEASGKLGISSPLLNYQDVLFWAGVAWTFYGLFQLGHSVFARRAVAASGWLLILILTGLRMEYLLVDLAVCHPLTYHMMVLSGVAIQVSLEHQINAASPMVPAAIACIVLIAQVIRLLAPNGGEDVYRRFHSLPCLSILLIYAGVSHFWITKHPQQAVSAANPEYVLVKSLLEPQIPSIDDSIPAAYFSDFQPHSHPASASPILPAIGWRAARLRHRPLNLVLVVMESVGANRLDLYNPAARTTPKLRALARHALIFQRVYGAEAETSAAMPGLFCSVYPAHSPFSIPREMPDIAIPGLPAVLADHGYRTAFIHNGQLVYDNQKDFLSDHGFAEILDAPRDYPYPRDSEVVPAAVRWIKSDPGQPFFLTIWTQDTHHPYLNPVQQGGQGAPPFDRYRHAVHSTDSLFGQIADALARLRLADDTLLVITGDHGEAFREHDVLIHGLSVYNEELHLPLMIVNPRLLAHEIRMKSIGRQIDIAPTLLDLLGYDAPAAWQGMSLLRTVRARRAYLFSIAGDFTMGVVDGDFKYIYDFIEARPQLYNLANDPGEHDDLSSDAANSPMMRRAQLRLEAWLAFQNRYLARFGDATAKPVYVSAEGTAG
jgi:arylsulfatase A-like enzyme